MATLPTTPITPLRYPGGKGALAQFLADLIVLNGLEGCNYYELFAGGCGAGLILLRQNIVDSVHINDADFRVFSFWNAVLNHTDEFIERISTVPLDVEEWQRQKEIYTLNGEADPFDLGFATFYLNRTNRSGILYKAGPIGGFDQLGNYKINARFHRDNLIKRVEILHELSDRIIISNEAAERVIGNIQANDDAGNDFYYLDPPYYEKGSALYLNNYMHAQHLRLSQLMTTAPIQNWLISYDSVKEISHFYEDYRRSTFNLHYSLHNKRIGSELLIFSPTLRIPDTITIRNRTSDLTVTLPGFHAEL